MAVSDREKQIERDRYYLRLAEAVETSADCLGTHVGAVLVLENRVISTGYNGTPSSFPNCEDGGCIRCLDSWYLKNDRADEVTDPAHVSGAALDRCICVHAEPNAFITAARFGIRIQGATLYTTQSPCFSCLKEAVQADIKRIVYKTWYPAKYIPPLRKLYYGLADHLATTPEGKVDPTRFEARGGGDAPRAEGQPDPYREEEIDAEELEPSKPSVS